MLDDLLGRTELKEEIAALESDVESLENQLEAEKQRRADAVTDRQSAQERANRLEDRVTELEDRVQRLQSEESGQRFRAEQELIGRRLGEILARLDSVETEPEGALSAFVPDGHDLPEAVRDAVGERAGLSVAPRPAWCSPTTPGWCRSVCARP